MSGWRIAGLVCFAAALVEGWQGQTSAAAGMMVLAIGCAGVALARRPRTQTQRIAALSAEQLAAVPAEEQALATELYEKAQRDYLAVEQARHAVKDERLARALAALQPVSARIMGYLRQHPEKILPQRLTLLRTHSRLSENLHKIPEGSPISWRRHHQTPTPTSR